MPINRHLRYSARILTFNETYQGTKTFKGKIKKNGDSRFECGKTITCLMTESPAKVRADICENRVFRIKNANVTSLERHGETQR